MSQTGHKFIHATFDSTTDFDNEIIAADPMFKIVRKNRKTSRIGLIQAPLRLEMNSADRAVLTRVAENVGVTDRARMCIPIRSRDALRSPAGDGLAGILHTTSLLFKLISKEFTLLGRLARITQYREWHRCAAEWRTQPSHRSEYTQRNKSGGSNNVLRSGGVDRYLCNSLYFRLHRNIHHVIVQLTLYPSYPSYPS